MGLPAWNWKSPKGKGDALCVDGEGGRQVGRQRGPGIGWAESDAADKATNPSLVFLTVRGWEVGVGTERGGLFLEEELGGRLPAFPLFWLLRNLGGPARWVGPGRRPGKSGGGRAWEGGEGERSEPSRPHSSDRTRNSSRTEAGETEKERHTHTET